MRKCHLFCASMHQNVPYGTKQDINNGSEMNVSATAHAPCQDALTSTKQMEGKTRTLSYILEIATKCDLS